MSHSLGLDYDFMETGLESPFLLSRASLTNRFQIYDSGQTSLSRVKFNFTKILNIASFSVWKC